MSEKLAIISTHPIQYNAPWFRLLAERNQIEIKVFYTWSQVEKEGKYDPGFGKEIAWDIPLLEGYAYEFVENTSTSPGTRQYKGIVNPGLIERIHLFKPDAILVSGWNFKSHLQCMRHFHGKIPVIFRGDSTLLDERPGIKTLLRRMALRWVFGHIDVALYVGEANKAYYKKHGLREAQLVFAPHAIDNDRFAASAEQGEKAARLREYLGIPRTAQVWVYAGKFEPKKDPLLLLRAFKQITTPGLHLVMVGDGQLKAKLLGLAAGAGNIHFMEFQNQQSMPAVYAMADLFILPSRGPGETWGLAVNEAMAAGKAVLLSNRCGCAPDLVKQAESGWIFAAGNEEDLLDTMRQVPAENHLLAAMGKRGAEKIQYYNFKQIAMAIEARMDTLKKTF